MIQNISDSACLHAEILELFHGDQHLIEEWLRTPLPLLAARSPSELMESEDWTELRRILDRTKLGDFA